MSRRVVVTGGAKGIGRAAAERFAALRDRRRDQSHPGVAAELTGTGVRANAVCPSFVRPEMTARSVANFVQRTGRATAQAEATLAAVSPLCRRCAAAVSPLSRRCAAAVPPLCRRCVAAVPPLCRRKRMTTSQTQRPAARTDCREGPTMLAPPRPRSA